MTVVKRRRLLELSMFLRLSQRVPYESEESQRDPMIQG